jgi:hypothetical protein
MMYNCIMYTCMYTCIMYTCIMYTCIMYTFMYAVVLRAGLNARCIEERVTVIVRGGECND